MSISTMTAAQKIFAEDVHKGLTADRKHISSKYFYDKKGDALFENIMRCEDYYLTFSELEILTLRSGEILNTCAFPQKKIDIIELGAGDGFKTRRLLDRAIEDGFDITYVPIDISPNAVTKLVTKLSNERPQIETRGEVGDYFNILDRLQNSYTPKLILFLGSTIGNMQDDTAVRFLSKVAEFMNPADRFLIGFDQKKEPTIIRAAYNDQQGFTRDFNLNLLHRINSELGGNFNVDYFHHYPIYNPHSGRAKSYLVSEVQQDVHIKALNHTYSFEAWESIHTEISQKYNEVDIKRITSASNLEYLDRFTDVKDYFSDVLLKTS
ncbi:MAG: L-histidine N(alpha)-methyltransferase [Flavobacteriales bacterium]